MQMQIKIVSAVYNLVQNQNKPIRVKANSMDFERSEFKMESRVC